MWSDSQKGCLQRMGICLYTAIPLDNSTQTNTIFDALSGNKHNPVICLILQSQEPKQMMAGTQLLHDVLHFLKIELEDIAWVHNSTADKQLLSMLNCPLWPQNAHTFDSLNQQFTCLPSMASLLSAPTTEKPRLWHALKKIHGSH